MMYWYSRICYVIVGLIAHWSFGGHNFGFSVTVFMYADSSGSCF